MSQEDASSQNRVYQRDGHNRRLPMGYMHSAPIGIQRKLMTQAIEWSLLGFGLTELCIIDTPGADPEVVPVCDVPETDFGNIK